MYILLTSSCVTQKEYARVLDQYLNSEIEKKAQMLECDSIKRAILKENSDFKYQLEKLMDKSAELVTQKDSLKNVIDGLNTQYSSSQQEYLQKLKTAADKDQKTNADLIQMQLDLEKQKFDLDKKESDLKKLTADLLLRETKIAELEKLLSDQKLQSEQLRDAIKKALTDFSAGELSVYTKDGKVYVSMSDKLLFKSGSTLVESKGVEALGKIADVVKKNPDIQVNIEGHTDNVPYASNGGLLKDNWDLSLMRASSVLHIMTDKYKVNAKQIIGSGRGEFFPIESNATPDGRAKNRRTEIILTPKIDQLFNLIGK
ncbi:MAG: OmpA family protein [Saprospirales bacterium]|nr:OmpA family protein [Saprospirales bacterium]